MTPATTAIFFDVDFTLIYPKSTFDVGGYQSFGARHGLSVSLDPERFTAAIATASTELDRGDDLVHRSEPFVRFARRVLEEMGGQGPGPPWDPGPLRRGPRAPYGALTSNSD